MDTIVLPNARSNRATLTLSIAWAVTLGVSILPDILYKELTGAVPGWLFEAKLVGLVVLLAASLAWSSLKPLRAYFLVILVLFSLTWSIAQVLEALSFADRVTGMQPYIQSMLLVQVPRFSLAMLMTGFLWVLTRDRRKFFFVKGNLATEAAPIPWIMSRPTSWRILGPFLSIVLSLGLVVFMWVFGTPPSLNLFIKALPLLPFILFFAATNAFGEEMNYRASFLAPLEGAISPRQALLMTAAFFGIEHYYGVPYGVIGVVMSAFVGWLMGKAMLETRGLFWSWWIHFCMDVAVFIFIAMGSVTPGG
jgi:CAAX protease family protein